MSFRIFVLPSTPHPVRNNRAGTGNPRAARASHAMRMRANAFHDHPKSRPDQGPPHGSRHEPGLFALAANHFMRLQARTRRDENRTSVLFDLVVFMPSQCTFS
jgi:hypothetical protein